MVESTVDSIQIVIALFHSKALNIPQIPIGHLRSDRYRPRQSNFVDDVLVDEHRPEICLPISVSYLIRQAFRNPCKLLRSHGRTLSANLQHKERRLAVFKRFHFRTTRNAVRRFRHLTGCAVS